MRYRTWNVRGLYRAGSLKTLRSDEIAKYKLDLVPIQMIRWVEGGSQPTKDDVFFQVNENANHHLWTGFFIHKGISSAVKVKFISYRM
jgi:hypothetical protein